MTAPRVTSCPHCSTSFRVTQAQMEAANGAVRCGSCLQVFNAQEYLDKKESGQPVSPVKNKRPASVIPEETQTNNHDSFSADTETSSQSKQAFSQESLSQESLSQESLSQESLSQESLSQESLSQESLSQESLSQESFLVDDIEPEFSTSEESTSKKESLNEIDFALGQLGQDEINFPESNFKTIKWKKKLLMGTTATLLAALLFFQYAWFQRNTLSLNPKLRPSYDTLCQLLTCKLPPLVNIEAIKSLQLLVRSHPKTSNALLVDTVIINNASHPQPYPTLHLSFTDINGNLVANRAFTPSEYLGGELAGSKEMPVGRPIRLGLEIIDPGQEAINYALGFSKNQ